MTGERAPRIEPLPRGGGFGARVVGVDLAAGIDAATWEMLARAWARHPLLLFADHGHLRVDGHVAFVERFGAVLEERLPGDRHSYVTNAAGLGTDDMNAGYREGELTPHMDYTYTPHPAEVISLLAEALPQCGTHTLFYSNEAPLRALPAERREALRAYTIRCAHDLAAMRPDARLAYEPRTRVEAPTQWHDWPLVRRHPRRDVDVLFCSLQQTERVLELSDEADDDRASRALLQELYEEWLYVPSNELRHEWSQGDLVVWDNLAVQHARAACPATAGPRTFRRVAACSAGNGVQDTVEFLKLADTSVAFAG